MFLMFLNINVSKTNAGIKSLPQQWTKFSGFGLSQLIRQNAQYEYVLVMYA